MHLHSPNCSYMLTHNEVFYVMAEVGITEDTANIRRPITSASVVAVASDLLTREVADEVAVFCNQSRECFGLSGIGAQVWRLMEETIAVRAIRDVLLREYEVDEGKCEADLLILLEELAAEGLITVDNNLSA